MRAHRSHPAQWSIRAMLCVATWSAKACHAAAARTCLLCCLVVVVIDHLSVVVRDLPIQPRFLSCGSSEPQSRCMASSVLCSLSVSKLETQAVHTACRLDLSCAACASEVALPRLLWLVHAEAHRSCIAIEHIRHLQPSDRQRCWVLVRRPALICPAVMSCMLCVSNT